MSRTVVVVNPRSGGGRTGAAWTDLGPALADALGPCDVRATQSPGDGRRLAAEAAHGGAALVVAVGGDGTLSEVVDGLLAARAERGGDGPDLGIVPSGTGSDFARGLGLPRDRADALRALGSGSVRRIDAGRAAYVAHDGSAATRHFLNVASLGLTAAAAAFANASTKRLGARVTYAAAVLRAVLVCGNADLVLHADGAELPRRAVLFAALGNGPFSGGGIPICPGARPDDGLLRLALARGIGRVRRLVNLPGTYLGPRFLAGVVEHRDVTRLDAAPAVAGAVVPIELDGEPVGRLPATFEVLPRALALRC